MLKVLDPNRVVAIQIITVALQDNFREAILNQHVVVVVQKFHPLSPELILAFLESDWQLKVLTLSHLDVTVWIVPEVSSVAKLLFEIPVLGVALCVTIIHGLDVLDVVTWAKFDDTVLIGGHLVRLSVV